MRRLLSLQHHDLGDDEIDRVQERLRDVSAHLREFIMLMHSCQPIVSRPLPTNILRDGQMFGRHVEKESVINFLLHTTTTTSGGCCSSGEGVVGVLPIVGDKGVGKTTLVQHACDDARVRDHFAVIMLCRWTYTTTTSTNGSGTYHPVLQYSKLTSVTGDAGGVDLNDDDALQGYFRDKRFLMVFEDVDMSKVRMLEGLLSRFGRRSRSKQDELGSKVGVIVTTNSRHVVAAMGRTAVEPITLEFLPLPEYWFFFKAHAFAGRDAEENPRLVAVGKAIAMKLNGSFFGAKTIGEVLRDQPDPRFWSLVLGNTVAGLSLLGDCIADQLWDLAHSLLPGHVEMCEIITVSTSHFPCQTTKLVRLQDLCRAAPHHDALTCWADNSVRFGNVLLCKSVFPFHSAYHIARCSCTCSAGQRPNILSVL